MKRFKLVTLLVGMLGAASPLMAADGMSQQNVTPKSQQQVASMVNINKANIDQLQQLKGVGKKKAQAIMKYRQTNGEFKTVEQITEVSGIGENFIKLNGKNIAL
ncbi:ComEA family DNA-binding protein [Shewanella intestini]|uniref:Helix-hairpin-helix domain-containing protein n=1 Tax=Shewanella intestini TaxID=2017544 RepID=A0ABS5I5G0_9GAMM|nr:MULTISPECIES: helix-hairpin-helix domain-containing protein [Shewanella]MBR9729257.1 helix-hairpin-helix domain-containing protein [Shewanella intestini]MRG35402.1 competence protein [Shewanella sp. XMDDZSB0408]